MTENRNPHLLQAYMEWPTINLPIPIFLHAVGLTILGIYHTFRSTRSSSAPPTQGLVTTGLGLAYLFTAYMPIAENQFLHASVPVRVILASAAGLRAALAKAGEESVASQLWGIMLYDGIGGFLAGWSLGRWDGKVGAY